MILLLFGLGTLALTVSVLRLDGGLRSLVRWGRFTPVTLGWGVGGGVLAAAPVLLLSLLTPMTERGGAVLPAGRRAGLSRRRRRPGRRARSQK
ncbi:hypothetical protein ACFOY2_22090 [Nonomuraea purpurea]|uniref:Uncharacterized protein n=1 Tax=Nonomuraea purpurea TaxID=1849276 RepID=A0ABV8G7F8_9ACTN